MSLMLRKACQEILDTNVLQNYHVDINVDTKQLDIVGECGRILVSIAGIKFVKLQPSRAEIEYAVELLNAFLVAHSSRIYTYLEALGKFNKKPVMERDTDKYKITNNGLPVKGIIGYRILYKDDFFLYTLDNASTNAPVLTTIRNSNLSIDALRALSHWNFDFQAFKDAKAYLKKYTAYANEERKLKNQLLELSVCDI